MIFVYNYWFWIALILLILFCISLVFLYKFSMILINMEDALEDCLDLLDERYESMSKILETPVFFDSMEVRQVVNNLKRSRDAVLVVANVLTKKVTTSKKIENKDG